MISRRTRPSSRKSRGLRSLGDLDGRTSAARRARELVAGLESDLGGTDCVTVGQRELIKRAALLGAITEDTEVKWLQREEVDIPTYLAAINTQRRCLTSLGLGRVARDITPTLEQYAAQRSSESAANDDD